MDLCVRMVRRRPAFIRGGYDARSAALAYGNQMAPEAQRWWKENKEEIEEGSRNGGKCRHSGESRNGGVPEENAEAWWGLGVLSGCTGFAASKHVYRTAGWRLIGVIARVSVRIRSSDWPSDWPSRRRCGYDDARADFSSRSLRVTVVCARGSMRRQLVLVLWRGLSVAWPVELVWVISQPVQILEAKPTRYMCQWRRRQALHKSN